MRITNAFSILAGLALASGAHAEVKGQFKVDKTIIAPKHACAYAIRPQFNPRQRGVEIVLSEGPCDASAAIKELDPHTQMINQEGLRTANYILISVDPAGKVGMNATLSETMAQYLDSTVSGLKAELTVNTPERVAGRIYNPQPVKTHDGQLYQADFTFDVAVIRPPAGVKLPADGGEPGRAFAALYAAIAKKDIDVVRAHLTPETLGRLEADYNTPEENRDSVLETLGFWLPKKDTKVTGGESFGETAILEVEGKVYETSTGLYLIRMVKRATGWAMDEARMVGMM